MRWGLIGTGQWADRVHAPSLAAHPEVDFVGVWGRDHHRGAVLADRHLVRAFDTLDDLLARVDALSFAVAPSAQAELGRRALDRDVHVLLEKPVATDPAAVRELAARRKPGQRTTVFLTRLFDPARSQWLRGALDGGFTHAEVAWVSSALQPGSVTAESAWRRGVGIIWDLMPHLLAQLTPVLGDVARGSARPWTKKDGLIVELEHVGGVRSDIRMTLSADPSERAEWIRFSGPQGESLSPRGPLDSIAAHRAAVDTIVRGADLSADPLLQAASIDAALAPTALMQTLVAELAVPFDERLIASDGLSG